MPHLEDRPALPRTGPWASLSRAALRHNVALAVTGAEEPGVSPLAADAWGHGAAWVRDALPGFAVERMDGASLYGLPGGHADARPVLSLHGRVLSTKVLRAGEGVSYGYTHRAPEDTRVALVSGGYAQGIVRALGNRVAVDVAGVRCPIVGRVAMDVCVIDIAALEVARGDEVVYFGDPAQGRPPLAGWERATGWSAVEIVTAIGLRVAREVVA